VVGEHGLASVIAELLGIPLADKPRFHFVSVVNGELSKRFLKENLVVPLVQQEHRPVLHHADASQTHEQAISRGMRTIYHDGLLKVLSGTTNAGG
jgi:hypothetical protein